MGMSQIEGGFRTSPEASNVAPNEITQYYNDILLREPEADELQFWLDEFVNGMSYSDIEYEIRNSEEAQLLQVPTRSSFAIGSIGQIPMRGGELDSESTLNVGGPKNAGLDTGPRAMGTFLSEISSDLVCGGTLCDEPLSIEEKIEMYLKNRGLETPSRHQVS